MLNKHFLDVGVWKPLVFPPLFPIQKAHQSIAWEHGCHRIPQELFRTGADEQSWHLVKRVLSGAWSTKDSVGEGEGGMFQENSIETCILSRVKQITSPSWMHETSARTWCTGKSQGIGSRGRWERGSGWGTHVNPWLIHVNVSQKPLQYCKVISLQLIKINEKKISR